MKNFYRLLFDSYDENEKYGVAIAPKGNTI